MADRTVRSISTQLLLHSTLYFAVYNGPSARARTPPFPGRRRDVSAAPQGEPPDSQDPPRPPPGAVSPAETRPCASRRWGLSKNVACPPHGSFPGKNQRFCSTPHRPHPGKNCGMEPAPSRCASSRGNKVHRKPTRERAVTDPLGSHPGKKMLGVAARRRDDAGATPAGLCNATRLV